MVDLQLSDRSADDYIGVVKCFERWFEKPLTLATRDDIRNYLLSQYGHAAPNTRANQIRGFRAFYKRFLASPITDTFRYPTAPFNPKHVHSKEQLSN
jgi:hypothetical protein